MNSHLVTVKVCVKSSTDERVQLDRLALDQDRVKRLNAKPVQGWSTIEHNRMLANDVFEEIPDFRNLLFDQSLG